MKISIYIPVFNQREELRRTLRALIPEKDGHEVFIVDRGSSDGSPDVAREHDWVRVLDSDAAPLSRALNEAVQTGDGEILFFLRPGGIPARGWSEVLEEQLGKDIDAGHFHTREADPAFPWAAAVRGLARKFGHQLIGGPSSLNGVAVKRDLFAQVEGFQPVPEFEWLAFANRLRQAGATVKPIGHEVLTAPAPGSRQADAWEELKDDLVAAWKYRKTENFDPVRSRRRASAAILFGYDVFPEDTAGEYVDYARDELLKLSLERMQSFRGVERIYFIGGKKTTDLIGQPSGVEIVGKHKSGLQKRFEGLVKQLKDEGVEGLMLVRGVSEELTHRALQDLSEGEGEAPCLILPEADSPEWLALWLEPAALEAVEGWELAPEYAPLQAHLKTKAVRQEVEAGIHRLRTDSDARALYYAGILDRVPA